MDAAGWAAIPSRSRSAIAIGRRIAQGRQGRVVSRQLRLARTRSAMPRQGTQDHRAPRARGRYSGGAAMVDAAAWVARDRISLMGWANGASALLWAVRPQLLLRHAEPDFRSAVAFYPDCRLSSGLGWSARVPTLVLIGAKDDVSSPPACRQMVEGAHGRSALTRIVVYPSAYHDFDRPNLPVHAIGPNPRCRRSGKGPRRHRCRSARQFAKARRRVAGASSSRRSPADAASSSGLRSTSV